jgi:hypothetical protein
MTVYLIVGVVARSVSADDPKVEVNRRRLIR